mmetsp:Transcript_74276/g.143852  ORF Transcript_74276/g.143852 Transcript_74276/m.143852 type:complete len:167 (+) Transcript_74276:86-586(+)
MEDDPWGETLQEFLIDVGACYAAGLAQLEDGLFYAAAPVADDAGWGFIFKDSYKEHILQPDGETEKEMDIWEGAGLKMAIETGKKPDWGLWLGGKKYNITSFEPDLKCGDYTLPVLFCQRPKAGVVICSTGSQIVAGFYDDEKGQNADNCQKAVSDLVQFLKDKGL